MNKYRVKVEVYPKIENPLCKSEPQYWACLFSETDAHTAKRRMVQDWLERGFWVRKITLEKNKTRKKRS